MQGEAQNCFNKPSREFWYTLKCANHVSEPTPGKERLLQWLKLSDYASWSLGEGPLLRADNWIKTNTLIAKKVSENGSVEGWVDRCWESHLFAFFLLKQHSEGERPGDFESKQIQFGDLIPSLSEINGKLLHGRHLCFVISEIRIMLLSKRFCDCNIVSIE